MRLDPPRRTPFAFVCCVSFALLGAAFLAQAQPSGGPYGPIPQRYELPTVSGRIHYAAPDGRPDATGRTLGEPTTLETAISRVVTGDAIVLRGGVYRTGELQLNQGITIQPYADEQPVLKGTLIADRWEAQENGLWRTSWKRLFPARPANWWRRHREGRSTPLHRFNNDMVFVDGRMLQSVGWEGEIDENSYYIDYESGQVYIGIDPTNRLVEITAFDGGLLRTTGEVHGKRSDGKGPVIRGLTFTQYAYRAIEIEGTNPEDVSPESAHGKEVVGTTLEHVTLSHCSRVGGYFRGDKMVFRHCLVSDTSTEGIFILSSNDVLLEKNIITRNNIEQITGYYPAAVKIFNQCYRVVCRDNLVIDHPDSNGIWYDVGNVDGVFVNNWIERTDNGFFFEISKGAICAGNVFVDCPTGVYVLNASGVQVHQNTFFNSTVRFERTTRSAVGDHFDWHPRSGPDVPERHNHAFVGNLLVANASYARPLIQFEQSPELSERLTEPQVARYDYNLYVRSNDAPKRPLIAWGPKTGEKKSVPLDSPAAVNRLHPAFESHSQYSTARYRAIFKSPELGRFELIDASPLAVPASTLPENFVQLLNWSRRDTYSQGAYQPR
jgi:hypothetical protein